MTAVCLKAKNSVKACAWSSVFTSFNTDTKSCLFIKQLTSTCISTILYLRKVLPDDYFEEKNFEGMTLKLLKSRKDNNYLQKIEQWLEGAFEAIEKKYLKRLMLDIQDGESNLTLEIYSMTFNYNKEKNNLNPEYSESTTKLNTIRLLQMCYAVTQSYSSLPSKVKLSMRLSYHKNTPENYQPNGYMAWDAGEPEFPKQPRNIEIGVAGTQHHFFKFLNKSCLNDDFFKNMENQLQNGNSTPPIGAITEAQVTTENCEEKRQIKAKRELCFVNSTKNIETTGQGKKNEEALIRVPETVPDTLNHYRNVKVEPLESNTKKITTFTTTKNVRVLNKLPIKGDLKVRCACLGSEISDTMFPCLSCKFLVHGECFGLLKFDGSKKIRFYCHLCHQTEPSLKCHDKVLLNLKNSTDQQKLALLRRVLRYCTTPSVGKITLKKIEKIAGSAVPKNVCNIILNKMTEIGVAIPQGRKKTHLIDRQMLSNQLMHYFYKVQSSSQSQSQILSCTLQTSDNTKSKNDNELAANRNKPLPAPLKECITINSETSQQSYDIFGL